MAEGQSDQGRRARKRRATDRAIALAGVELALELGYDNATVEAICARADVSRSTFFNYYPTRDAAILGRTVPMLDDSTIAAAFEAHRADPVLAVFLLARDHLGTSGAADEHVAALRTRLLATQPAVVRQYSAGLITSQTNLTIAVFRGLSANPDDARLPGDPLREATLAVATAYSLLYAATEGWQRPLSDDLVATLTHRRDQLRTVLGVSA